MSYLEKSRCAKSISFRDLNHVLGLLKNLQDVGENSSQKNEKYILGEHIITVWRDYESEKLRWYLGIVDRVLSNEILDVSYFEPCDSSLKTWGLVDSS